ncbi:hypothetical protein FHE72_20470 [Rossellomorea vietnamensis]|uniref:Uncharacterized protein n=1 Tax=Rossellomorea vietnamensis TaxID=218284 RepID=A0A6I6UVX8_9BACI|nr:hypothetical protein [Rossellomorea vietnamensis]QHE63116.1 hypothetical protein FHE72_20470 [Rossellomorea vietnamensis]
MSFHEIKSFLHLEKVKQSSIMTVTYCWEIKLAYYEEEGYYGYAYTTRNQDEIKWEKLNTNSNKEAAEIMKKKCKSHSK